MKKLYKKLFILFFFISINTSASAESTVFLDIDYVLNNSNLGKLIYSDLEKLNKKNLESLELKEKTIKKKKESIEIKSNISSKEQLKDEINLFNKEVEKYRLEKNELLKNFKIKKKNDLDKFLTKINPIIQTYMKDNSIDIVLDKKQIFVGSINKDITEEILKLVNKTY